MYLTFYCPLQNQIISLKQNIVNLYSSTKILKTKKRVKVACVCLTVAAFSVEWQDP